jgi:hypothetical protein
MSSSFNPFTASVSVSALLLLGSACLPAIADDAQARWYDPRTWTVQSAKAETEVEATGMIHESPGSKGDLDSDSDYEKLRLYRTVNLATRQQMVSQRALAGYCLAELEDQAVASQMLNQSLQVFDSQARRLKGKPVANDPGIHAKLADIEQTWQQLREHADANGRNPSALPLVELTDLLVSETDELVERMIAKLDDDEGVMVAESGRQRMLGQRVAALALCKKTGVSESLVEGKIDIIMADLESSNRELYQRSNGNARVQRELDAAYVKIGHIRETIAAEQWETYRLLEVSDFFVESMNRATRKLADSAAEKV